MNWLALIVAGGLIVWVVQSWIEMRSRVRTLERTIRRFENLFGMYRHDLIDPPSIASDRAALEATVRTCLVELEPGQKRWDDVDERDEAH